MTPSYIYHTVKPVKTTNSNTKKLLLFRKPTEPQCFQKGECQEGNFLGNSISTTYESCLNYCHQVKDCKWFSYRPSTKACLAFSECSGLNSSGCQECISGEVGCNTTYSCKTKGLCKGSLLNTVNFLL